MPLIGNIYNNTEENDRELWRRSLAEAGLVLVDGSFQKGATVTSATDAVWDIDGAQCYTWTGAFPHDANGAPGVGWVGVGDAALRQELAGSGGYKNIGQVKSVAYLMMLAGNHGDRVLLESYYDGWVATNEGEPLGGGEFYFDSSKKEINNGVTIFNGWVRKIVNQTLTTHDAGLISNDGTDATDKLQVLMDSLSDKCNRIVISGKHSTKKRIYIASKSGFEIIGVNDGAIDGLAFSSDWSFVGGKFSDGILELNECNNGVICGLEVVGAKKRNMESAPYQSGDSGIYLNKCNAITIKKNHIHDVMAWGVICKGCVEIRVYNNRIHDCVRQSAVNAIDGGSDSWVYNNILYNCGLYGVESETPDYAATMTYGSYAYGNTIYNCKYGMFMGVLEKGRFWDNTISKCSLGIGTRYCFEGANYNLEPNTDRFLSLNDNTIQDCANGISIISSTGVQVVGNTIKISDYPDAFIYDQYVTVDEIASGRMSFNYASFYVSGFTPGQPIGRVLVIAGGKYTVVESEVLEDRTEFGYPAGYATGACMVKVTLDKALSSDVRLFDFVKWMEHPNISTQTTGVAVRSENIKNPKTGVTTNRTCDGLAVKGNVIDGVGRGLYLPFVGYTNATISFKQFYQQNTFVNVNRWVFGYGYGILLDDNSVASKSGEFVGAPSLTVGDTSDYLNNLFPTDRIKLTFVGGKSGVTQYQTMVIKKACAIFSAKINFVGNVSTTGDIVIKINDSEVNVVTITQAQLVANTSVNKFFSVTRVINSDFWPANYTIRVTSTTGDLVYDNLNLELWCL